MPNQYAEQCARGVLTYLHTYKEVTDPLMAQEIIELFCSDRQREFKTIEDACKYIQQKWPEFLIWLKRENIC